jgi:diaminopropionate ammonia-lyase
MACLAAGETSAAAWTILKGCVDDALKLEDDAARHAMRVLAANNPSVISGESGCVGIAGLLAACANKKLRLELGLDESATILCINSEGNTDPTSYNETVS